jgi:hypothetical protein
MENTTRTNGMVESLNDETLNLIREKIYSLDERGYRVPEIPDVTEKAGMITALKNAVGGKKYVIHNSTSLSKKKHLRKLAHRFLVRPSILNANLYLHFLFKKVLEADVVPKVQLSEKEEKIIASRKAWKIARAEAEKCRIAYRIEKGDFYKKK